MLPAPLEALILRMLDEDPAERPRSLDEAAATLAAIAAARPPMTTPFPVIPQL